MTYFIRRRRIALFFLFFGVVIAMMLSFKLWVDPPVRKTVPLRVGAVAVIR
ncbi:MAG: hypothetical protein HPY81_03360 [Firmicutes bacterium]|nr:hypothetical protein [Bacillota bacterium]